MDEWMNSPWPYWVESNGMHSIIFIQTPPPPPVEQVTYKVPSCVLELQSPSVPGKEPHSGPTMTTFSTNNFAHSGRSFGGGHFRGSSLRGSSQFCMMASGGGRHLMVPRAPSMYGGSGGLGVHISSVLSPLASGATGYGFNAGSGGGFGFAAGSGVGFSGEAAVGDLSLAPAVKEKATMKNLNDRLAAYIEKVHSLENANADLELKIRQFVENKTSPDAKDYSAFQEIIRDLQDKIWEATRENGDIYLSIDNAKLAADDFKIRYENELYIRQSVESDIAGLRRLLDSMTLDMSDLETRIEVSKEDMAILKRNHKEDLEAMRTEMSGKVNVELKVEPAGDLHHVMEEIREQYEMMVAKKQRELEIWFKNKVEVLNNDLANNMSNLESSKSDVTEIRRTLQGLEVELQSQVSMLSSAVLLSLIIPVLPQKASLEDTLAKTQPHYSVQLSGLQTKVTEMEQQLVELKTDVERQAQEFKILLNIKTKLEMEINEYRRLLDDLGCTGSAWSTAGGSNGVNGEGSGISNCEDSDHGGVKSKGKMNVEEMVDGKVVSHMS